MVLDPVLATARSGLPSPLKSPTATEAGRAPTSNVVAGLALAASRHRCPPTPRPHSRRRWRATTSSLPSRLKSPDRQGTTGPRGDGNVPEPMKTGRPAAGRKRAVTIPEQHGHGVPAVIGDGLIRDAVLLKSPTAMDAGLFPVCVVCVRGEPLSLSRCGTCKNWRNSADARAVLATGNIWSCETFSS